MLKKLVATLFLPLAVVCTFAQTSNDPELLNIAGQSISKSEFERIYNKNNDSKTAEHKTPEEYLQMFINFKLKVLEAQKLNYDTVTAFREEMQTYREQLAQPYLNDPAVTENLVKEAFERLKWDIRASHIILKVTENAAPSDTLAAWNKMMSIKARLDKGEDFAKVARETSEDPYAKQYSGDIGYFSATQVVFPFELAAFSTPVGSYTGPVRTSFGYHIIKVTDRRPSLGQIKPAHILKKVTPDALPSEKDSAYQTIVAVYNRLKAGEDFAKLAAEFSDDNNSKNNGGILDWYSAGQTVPSFDSAAFKLNQPGDISQPVLSYFGWHIIKLIDRKPAGNPEDLRKKIESHISKDARQNKGREAVADRLKKEYGFKEHKDALQIFKTIIDTVSMRDWRFDEFNINLSNPLITIGDSTVYQIDLARFLDSKPSGRKTTPAPIWFERLYKTYVLQTVLDYEKNRLDAKYPDFKNLIQEYNDGILLFNISDSMIWTKASQDTVGLTAYYNQHKDRYMWNERAKALIFTCNSEEYAKQAAKFAAKNKPYDKWITKICSKDTTSSCIKVREILVEKGSEPLVDEAGWKVGLSPIKNINNHFVFVKTVEILAPAPKTLDEARGLYISDYQTYLEEKWIAELRTKYPVTINSEVLKLIK